MLELVSEGSSAGGSASLIHQVMVPPCAEIDGCRAGKTDMLSGTPASSDRFDRGMLASRKRSIRALLARLRGGVRIALAIALLACFASQPLCAQPAPRKLIVQRSTRAIPHRFLVHPSGVTVAANQVQHFEVTDAQGNPVAVHWNVSGLGCSGMDCGTIDDQGNYRTPPSLPQPRVVTLEGVLVSDPNYSVLAEVVIKDVVASAANPIPPRAPIRKAQELTAPEITRQNLTASTGLPLPNVVAAAPVIGRQNLASSAESLPLPNAIAAAPSVGNQNLARSAELPAASVIAAPPGIEDQRIENQRIGNQRIGNQTLARNPEPPRTIVIAAAPSVGDQTLTRSAELPPPNVIAAPPAVEKRNLTRSELPATIAIAAPPLIEKQNLARKSNLPPPSVITAPPSVANQTLTRSAELPPPNVIAAPPVVEKHKHDRAAELPTTIVIAAAPAVANQTLTRATALPPPDVVAPAPSAATQNFTRTVESPPKTVIAALTPIPAQVTPAREPLFSPPAAARQSPAGSPVLPSMPDVVVGLPGGSAASPPHENVVTYRDGQLTIDAENISLATLLQIIAEKTGAVIDVPKGTAQERIFEHAGPGPANDVLQRLLNGSPFNFIIVSSPLNPDQPAQVLLSVHAPETDAPVVAAVQPAAPVSPVLSKPPEPAPAVAYTIDPATLTPPKEQLSPEAIGELMKQKAQEIRQQIQRQQPQ